MIYDDAIPCLYGRDKAPFGVRACSSWYCPRCHRGLRNKYTSLLHRDFEYRPPEWFTKLQFVVLRPGRLIQAAPYENGIRLALEVLMQFHKLLRERVDYSHFSITEDTAWDKQTRRFHPSIHTHLLIHGEMTKATVREVYVQAHREVLGADVAEVDEGVVVYFEPCGAPSSAAAYILKHGKYRDQGRAFRGLDPHAHKRNPIRLNYSRQGKAGRPFFTRKVEELMAEVKQQWEARREERQLACRWCPPDDTSEGGEVHVDPHDEPPVTAAISLTQGTNIRRLPQGATQPHAAPLPDRKSRGMSPWGSSDRVRPVVRQRVRRRAHLARHRRPACRRRSTIRWGDQLQPVPAAGGVRLLVPAHARAPPLGFCRGARHDLRVRVLGRLRSRGPGHG